MTLSGLSTWPSLHYEAHYGTSRCISGPQTCAAMSVCTPKMCLSPLTSADMPLSTLLNGAGHDAATEAWSSGGGIAPGSIMCALGTWNGMFLCIFSGYILTASDSRSSKCSKSCILRSTYSFKAPGPSAAAVTAAGASAGVLADACVTMLRLLILFSWALMSLLLLL